MLNFLKKLFGVKDKTYVGHPEAVVITCFYNPTGSQIRVELFNRFYESIKHLNHRVIELALPEAEFITPESPYITRLRSASTMWHKETLLNKIVKDLPEQFKYVLWVDADLIFTNPNWVVDSVEVLKEKRIAQLFEYCVHLEEGQDAPDFDLKTAKHELLGGNRKDTLWAGFGFNWVKYPYLAHSNNYDIHGHVGFAWGAQRSLLDEIPLYEKALIGGADHIIAHAAVGQLSSRCILKAFEGPELAEIQEWSSKFFNKVKGSLGYVKGDVYHLWHGDIKKRDYLRRIQGWSKVTEKSPVYKDSDGLYTSTQPVQDFFLDYLLTREVTDNIVTELTEDDFQGFEGGDTGGAGSTGEWDAPDQDQVDVGYDSDSTDPNDQAGYDNSGSDTTSDSGDIDSSNFS